MKKQATTGISALMHLVASSTPLEHIKMISYPGQDPMKRMYKPGYEKYFNSLPLLEPGDNENGAAALDESKAVVLALASELVKSNWALTHEVPDGKFHRHIIGMEAPEIGSMFGDMPGTVGGQSLYVKKEGKELVVAHWGNGFVSPVHGHAPGLEVEVMLGGNLVVNRYRMLYPDSDVVRLVSSCLYTGESVIELAYTEEAPDAQFPRQNLIHNFVSYGTSHSLHYVPEHSRDGRDNGFKVEYFEDVYDLLAMDMKRLTIEEATQLQPGNVLLVRSANVPALRDHFCVITGGLTVKHGGHIRQKDVAIMTKDGVSTLLDGHTDFDSYRTSDTVILQLSAQDAEHFLQFHDIKIDSSGNEFDDVYDMRVSDVKPITTQEAISLRKGDVVLVRSVSLPEKGDHYILVTGHAIPKPHGMRPQTAVFPAMVDSPLLDVFDTPGSKAVLLKLNKEAKEAFHSHYGIHMDAEQNIVSDKLQLVMG